MTEGQKQEEALAGARREGMAGGKGIARRLAALRDALGPVEKDGHDKHLNRRYITTDATMGAVREAARAAGLATSCRQRVIDWGIKESGTYYALVEVAFVFADPDTGEYDEVIGIGMGEDKGARVVNIAVTYAIKNALRAGFLVGDDAESDAGEFAGGRAGAAAPSRATSRDGGGLSEDQAREIRSALAGVPGDHVRAYLTEFGASAPGDIPPERFDEAKSKAARLPRAANRRVS